MNNQKSRRERRKSRAIELLNDGKSRRGVMRIMGISEYTLLEYMREECMTKPSAEESKKLRDKRSRYAAKEIEAGRTKYSLAEELGVKVCTINAYLRTAGVLQRGQREANIEKAQRLQSSGMKKAEIASAMGLSTVTIDNYIGYARREEKMSCQECGIKAKLDRFRGKNLCPDCLNPAPEPTIEYAIAVGGMASGGSFYNGVTS